MSRDLNLYDRVRLVCSRFDDRGVSVGAEGYVVDQYDDGCFEVEFSNADGSTLAQIVASGHDVQSVLE